MEFHQDLASFLGKQVRSVEYLRTQLGKGGPGATSEWKHHPLTQTLTGFLGIRPANMK